METLSLGKPQSRYLCAGEWLCVVEELLHIFHQGVDGSMPVISRDMVVQLFPKTLDDVVIR